MNGAQVYLIRHGDTGEALKGRFVGRQDVPLSSLGQRQSAALGQCSELKSCKEAFCSPMLRVRETVGHSKLDLLCRQDEDLREIDFGRWEGLSFSEISRDFPAEVDCWARLKPDFRFPEGETYADFLQRIQQAAERIARTAASQSAPLAIFAHGGVIRALICQWLGLPAKHYLLFEVEPASVSAVRLFGDQGVLVRLNDLGHLGELPS
ncbi:adenosylcobalamin-5'-phosphate phosphatase, putative [Syntrophotalea carbinolica DSM 2380]|uniref:Alpha-ribazole phosphatase n=1 Tax=Syntrophotalea carbinolica (strain DSM 2380 / NBRC 103641 / GraBd1) TaxID=338963 RepID=Q3A796_SYNC1|nr:alpha-ribazole phosphatase [Syntrophotalea carbinolica]ABA87748.1 adenosylcobalamin-5'-phosphate phosphatase, putative [Syntrophotalea carbinolica DSM 2380]